MTSSTGSRPDATVAVGGHFSAEVDPEHAHVMVTVSAAGGDRARVLAQLAGRVEEIREVIRGYGEAIERVEGHAVCGQPQFKDKRPTEKVTGYSASTVLSVVVIDFTVLGDLVLRLADADMVAVAGPYWALRPDSPAFAQARSQAVRDARLHAEEYAVAAGAKLTGLVEISDTGLSSGKPSGPFAAGVPSAARMSREPSVAEQVEMDLSPIPQEVSATVEARFTLSQPDFS